MKTITQITNRLKEDPRNKEYSGKGILPVYQISSNARILIIGQAPGRKVEESGIPFDDKSGENLRDWMGISKQIFYSDKVAIVPMDFYYPGKAKNGDLPPRKFIAEEYHQEILKLMPKIELTILIGAYAIDYYLNGRKQKTLTEIVRNYRKYLPKYFPIVHPSPLNFRWQAKNPWFKAEVVPVLKGKVKQALGTTEK